MLVVRAAGVRTGVPFALLGVATWVALFESGVDPVVVGLSHGVGAARQARRGHAGAHRASGSAVESGAVTA